MGLELVDRHIIKAPTSTFINDMRKREVDPLIYVEWLLLFDEYNKANKSHKTMGCAPCYGMVYAWYKKELYKLDNHA
jgi:hypothetical protein